MRRVGTANRNEPPNPTMQPTSADSQTCLQGEIQALVEGRGADTQPGNRQQVHAASLKSLRGMTEKAAVEAADQEVKARFKIPRQANQKAAGCEKSQSETRAPPTRQTDGREEISLPGFFTMQG